MFRYFRNVLRGDSVLLIDVFDRQVELLPGVDSYSFYEVAADENILDPISNVSLCWCCSLSLEPCQDSSEGLFEEDFASDVNVRYECRIDFLLRAGWLMVRDFWQDDLVGYEESGTLVRFEEYYLVPHDSSRGLVEALVVTVN